MTHPSNHCRILISNVMDGQVMPLARVLKEQGFQVEEFDSRMMSWPYRLYMKPLQRLVTNFRKDIDLFGRSIYSLHPYREKKLQEAVSRFQPHILFVIRGHGYSPDFLRQMRDQYGIQKVMGWWTKGSKWFDLARAEVNHYNPFFFMNQEFVDRFRQEGHSHCHYLPHAANNYHYYPLERKKSIPVLFVGTWSLWRQRFIQAIVHQRPQVYGPKWLQSNPLNFSVLGCVKGRFLPPQEVNERYNQSKVVLNINISENSSGSGVGFNQRVFDVPASGAFLLTEKGQGLEGLYKIGEEIEAFSSPEELRDKLAFYLQKDGHRERIARKGYEKVKRFWTWEHRAKEIARFLDGSTGESGVRGVPEGSGG